MPRPLRKIEAGTIYHVTNRGRGRPPLFPEDADFEAFVRLLAEALHRFKVDLLAWCLIGNEWHLLLRPRTDEALSRFMGWIAVTHVRRHHMRHPKSGGHLYETRFKSFPVQADEHFLKVARYLHAIPLRARLVKRTRQWRWNDLTGQLPTAAWPMRKPKNWLAMVDVEIDPQQAQRLEQSIVRGTPFGDERWAQKAAKRHGLEAKLKPIGRPRKPLKQLSKRQKRRRMKRK